MMDGDYGWGGCSTVLLLVVAAILLIAPLGMGPLGPSFGLIILLLPVILVFILYFLHQASK
ncbi:hypothetical protein Peur_043843 [Populus x canadensis]|jgi:hypothetical protein